ncbi:COL6A [Mytilus coruscus]|uniref:COL6A n=1 Tax=Mytilus coruscus TaxID=42192 RepID=A0A6J8D847_MYTCO|nr:COL6A [Mytilus coruscus]
MSRGSRTDVPQIAVILTDGDPNDRADFASALLDLRKTNIIVFAIGVGRDRNHEKMLKIAGDPERVFEKKDYDNLRAIREELVDKFCDKEQSVGRDRNHEKMLKIAGDPERVFEKKDYDNLRAIREELINKFCDKEQSDPERVFEKKDYDNLRAIREELVDKFCDKEQSVGRDRNHEKMLKIAGDPERVFEKKDYDNLRAIRKELVDKFCDKEQKDEAKPNPCDKEKPCEGAMADVIFVADSSRSLGVKEFDKLKLFAKAVVKRFTVSPNDIQVGFINFGKRSKFEFKLNSYRDQNEVMKAISKVQYLDDRERMQLTFIGKALQMLKQEGFKKRNGGRGGKVPKIAIIITDGEPTDIVATHRLAKEAKQQGIIIFAIGVGKWLQPDELHLLASDPKTHHAFMVDNYDKLSFIEDTLAKKTCTAACFSSDINATR